MTAGKYLGRLFMSMRSTSFPGFDHAPAAKRKLHKLHALCNAINALLASYKGDFGVQTLQ